MPRVNTLRPARRQKAPMLKLGCRRAKQHEVNTIAKRRFKAKIYLRSGSIKEIFVEAENQFRVKELIDM